MFYKTILFHGHNHQNLNYLYKQSWWKGLIANWFSSNPPKLQVRDALQLLELISTFIFLCDLGGYINMVTTLQGCTTKESASHLQLGYRSFNAASRPALGHNLDSCPTGSRRSPGSNLLLEILGRLEVYLLRRPSL